MVIKHNLPALNANRNLGVNNKATAKNLEKLSSGYKINRSADDAAGLAISEKMRAQIGGLEKAAQNCENGIALIQTAEGGLNETHAILQRMRELAVQSANGTYQDEVDRENLDKELQAIKGEIDRIAASTHYNGINLLDGTVGGSWLKELASDNAAKTALETAISSPGTLNHTKIELFVADYDGEKAILTFNTNGVSTDGSAQTIVSLQVGDKCYTAILNGDRAVFNDENGDPVAELTNFLPMISGSMSNVLLTHGTAALFCNMMTTGDGLFIGTENTDLIFQIGANGSADQEVGLRVENTSSGNIGTLIATTLNPTGTIADIRIDSRAAAKDAIDIIDAAINQVSGIRASLGALQNRMEHTINNLGVTRENLQAAESSLRDTDMAKEMMEFTKNNILVQASQSMLAQANALPQGVLQLLQ